MIVGAPNVERVLTFEVKHDAVLIVDTNGVVPRQFVRERAAGVGNRDPRDVSGIYAAGDVANHYHPVFDRHIRVEHWQNAVKQGAAAARNMLGKPVAYDEVHWFWSDQYDATLQYAGFHTKWEQLVVRGRLDSGSFLACYVNEGRIDAAVGLNRARDVRRVMPLIKTRRAVNQEQLRDESVDWRSLHVSP